MQITSVELTVADVDAAAAYYRDVLGLAVDESTGGARMRIGRSELVLRAGPRGPGGHHLAITVPSSGFGEARDWLSRRITLLTSDGRDTFALGGVWNSESVYFDGPEGLVLELIARHSLANDVDTPFSSSGLLCISEVGIAVGDVAQTVGVLRDRLGVEVFGDGSARFTPVGDHDGLFIVVADDRSWFPTADRIASTLPVAVTLAGEDLHDPVRLSPTATIRRAHSAATAGHLDQSGSSRRG